MYRSASFRRKAVYHIRVRGFADAQPPVIHIARHGSLPVLTDAIATDIAMLRFTSCRTPAGRHLDTDIQ